MEHSERGRYVTEQVSLWIQDDGEHVGQARLNAARGSGNVATFLTRVIRQAPAYSAPWQVAQELAPNDYGRIDWESVARDLLDG